MRQAIETRYAGPTDHRGSRVIARCQAGRVIVSWDDALDVAANHARAAERLVAKLGWEWSNGAWHGGASADGRGFVFVWAGRGGWHAETAMIGR